MTKPKAIAVVGGGILGATIAHELGARRGHAVTLFDGGGVGRAGATGTSGGIVRVFDRDEDALMSALEGLRFYRAASGGTLVHARFAACGFFYLLRSVDRGVEAALGRLAANGYRAELMTAAGARQRFPWLVIHAGEALVYEPDAGCVDPAAVARALADRACAGGVLHLRREHVTGIAVENGRAAGVETSSGRHPADVVVVAAGIGTRSLLATLGIDLGLRTKRIQYVSVTAGVPWPAFFDEVTGLYGRPDGDGARGVGAGRVGDSSALWNVDPEGPREMDGVTAESIITLSRSRLAWAPGSASSTDGTLRFDSYTPTRRPLVGAAPLVGDLFLAAGMCGTGVKMAPAIARAVAEMVAHD